MRRRSTVSSVTTSPGSMPRRTRDTRPKRVTSLLAAGSVGRPTRTNCGSCHSAGGGGNGVKHGDLDNTLNHPNETIDFHMGVLDMQCVDCHTATDHRDPGHLHIGEAHRRQPCVLYRLSQLAPSPRRSPQQPHRPGRMRNVSYPGVRRQGSDETLVGLVDRGQDGLSDDPHEYLKIKGSFVYGTQLIPEYYWFDGTAERYLLGDPIDPEGSPSSTIRTGVSTIRSPRSTRSRSIGPSSRTTPLTTTSSSRISSATRGTGRSSTGISLCRTAPRHGLRFQRGYGFARSDMYWPLEHMVAPAGEALQCTMCHSDAGRLDWKALGYDADPMDTAGQRTIDGSDR